MSVVVYIGLGSNLGESEQILSIAAQELEEVAACGAISVSPFYVTEPVGPHDQPDFINAVAAFETDMSAEGLLDCCQELEQRHQRVRGEVQWGPRTLDLDILLYDDQMIETERLQVPHPQMALRRFVLQPLADIKPDLNIPGMGTLSDLLDVCPPLRMEKLPAHA